MSQAEIAAGALAPIDRAPSKGHCLRDFELSSLNGARVCLSNYRGKFNLVLILADQREETTALLLDVAAQYDKIKDLETEVLVLTRASLDQVSELKSVHNLPFPLLVDVDGRVHRMLGAVAPDGVAAAAVYITDKFAEVFGHYRRCDGQRLPAMLDILSWLEFINNQCPECEPPEWPVDGTLEHFSHMYRLADDSEERLSLAESRTSCCDLVYVFAKNALDSEQGE